MKAFLILIFIALGIYLLICVGIYSLQEKMIFPGPSLPENYVFHYPSELEGEEIRLSAEDGELHGLYFHAKNPQGVVLYFHGNGGSVQDWISVAPDFLRHDLNILIMDYRGYGKSRGKRNQEILLQDATLAYEYVAQKWPVNKILVYGYSLGSGFATHIASTQEVTCLMLQAPYVSLLKISRDQFAWLPVSVLLNYPMPSHEFISQVTCPIFMIHGTNDRVIPIEHGREMSKISKARSKYVVYEEIEGGNHNDLSSYRNYHDWLKEGIDLFLSVSGTVE